MSFLPFGYPTYDAPIPAPVPGSTGAFSLTIDLKWLPYLIGALFPLANPNTYISGGDVAAREAYDLMLACMTEVNVIDPCALATFAINGSGHLIYSCDSNAPVDLGLVVGSPGSTGATGATGAPGTNGTNGTNGSNGTNGNSVLHGTSNPSGGLGADGDFYVNTSSWFIFGPKASGAWPAGVALTGPTGATGAAGGTGATGPTGPAGITTLFATITPASNIAATETTMHTYTIPANTLGANGDSIEIEYEFFTGAVSRARHFRVYFAGAKVLEWLSAVGATQAINIKVRLVRDGTSSLRITGQLSQTTLAAPDGAQQGGVGATWSSTNVISITTQVISGADNETQMHYALGRLIRA